MDRKELDKLLEECDAYFVNYANTLTHDRNEAREIVQTVYVRVLGRSDSIRSHPTSYVTNAIYNEFCNRIRNKGRQKQSALETEENIPALQEESAIERMEEQDSLKMAIERAFSRTPEVNRTLIYGIANGKSYKALALEYGLRETEVRDRIYRARKILRKELKKVQHPCAA
ncbi:RNA polymerase sigma factor [Candidatus Woesearchaeota archaeon]|nr:RNA polymerase sigma factor [Candidatus Woesearchaeota archaeon]